MYELSMCVHYELHLLIYRIFRFYQQFSGLTADSERLGKGLRAIKCPAF